MPNLCNVKPNGQSLVAMGIEQTPSKTYQRIRSRKARHQPGEKINRDSATLVTKQTVSRQCYKCICCSTTYVAILVLGVVISYSLLTSGSVRLKDTDVDVVEEASVMPVGDGKEGEVVEEDWRRLCGAVDLVYTFVNGSTKEHQALQRRYIDAVHFERNSLENRFRDFGEASTLLYSLRSARKYAPWIRRTWVVVADKKDQTPSFLAEFDDIEVVEHRDVFNPGPGETWRQSEGMPNFNSCAIELQLHKIPGLAECYLYLNDDVLFTKALHPEDFIQETKPFSFTNYQAVPRSPKGQDEWGKKLLNVGRMFHAKTKMPRKNVHLVGHHGHFFVKSIVAEVVQLFAKDVSETVRSRYRTSRSLWLPLVYNNFLVWRYQAERKRVHALYYSLDNANGVQGALNVFKRLRDANGKYSWLCLNDNLTERAANYTEIVNALQTSLESLFPVGGSRAA